MAQRVGRDGAPRAGPQRVLSHDLVDCFPRHPPSAAREEEVTVRRIPHQRVASAPDVAVHDLQGAFGRRNDPFLVALAQDTKHPESLVDVRDGQVRQLAGPDPRCVEESFQENCGQCTTKI